MKTLFYSVAVIACVFLTSCASNETANSDAVKQTEIYQSYSVTYDAGDMELNASASFRFGGSTGTTLNLTSPSKVTFNGDDMARDNNIFSGTFYNISKQIDFKGQYEFKYTDNDKKTYTNNAVLASIELGEYPSQADKSTGLMVKWTAAVKNNERVYLYIEDAKNNSVYASTDMVGATSVEISTEEMKTLVPGNINIYLTREVNSSLADASHLGGNMYLKFISKKVGINLTGDAPAEAKK
jgi:hypothetical protein